MRRRATWAGLGLLAAGALGWMPMSRLWEKHRLRTLLGEPGAALLEGAELRVWQPDPDHAPQAYYLRRRLGPEGLAGLLADIGLQQGLQPGPVPAGPQGVWQLPAGLNWPDWQATARPGARQAQGQLGALGVWLREHDGQLQAVLLP